MTLPAPPRSDAPLARGLRAAFDRVGFGARSFSEVVGDGDAAAADSRAAAQPAPLATLLRLFALGAEVSLEQARHALGSRGADGAAKLGVVDIDGAVVRPLVRIVPHDILLLASDLPSPAPPAEHVAAAHGPSLTLARLTVRRRVARALDLGTGNGIQALLLASHAETVVATDLNERALHFTELNAALNGRTNIETRAGKSLEPVAGERFGCIVCSPPYVISPESGLLYRDAGVRGDVLSEQLVRELPALLDDGGFATVLVSWIPQHEEVEPLSWPPADCSALVLRLYEETAVATAEYWHADQPPAEARAGVERWLSFYTREGIDSIAYGAVLVRRSPAPPWRDWLDLPGGPTAPAGTQVERIFAAHESPPPANLVWAPDVRIERADGAATVSVQPGLGISVELSEEMLDAVRSGVTKDVTVQHVVRDLHSLGFLVARP